MIVICEGQWEPPKRPFSPFHSLDIAGLTVQVFDKGDHWVWSMSDCDGRPLGDGSADDETAAKQAAEDAIMLACNPKPVVPS